MGMHFFTQNLIFRDHYRVKEFYFRGLFNDRFLEPLLKNIKIKVAKYVSRFDLYPVLDICCGSGVQCKRVAEMGEDIYGLDLDFGLIRYASGKYPRIPFICADASQIPLRDASMKGAILSFSLHDKFPEIRVRILEEVKRILHPEGKVVIVDFENPWNITSKMASLYVYGIERMAGKVHFRNGRRFLSDGGLRSFLEKNDLEQIERYDVDLAHSSIVVAKYT